MRKTLNLALIKEYQKRILIRVPSKGHPRRRQLCLKTWLYPSDIFEQLSSISFPRLHVQPLKAHGVTQLQLSRRLLQS